MKKLPTTIVTGFLGSGKTTLMRHLLTHADGRRLAVIVNEFGEVGVDGDLLRQCSVGCDEDPSAPMPLYELANGCLCCTVQEEFVPVLETLVERRDRIDHILIETSGLALPKPLVQAFQWPEIRESCTVDAVVALVDGPAVLAGQFAHDPARVDGAKVIQPIRPCRPCLEFTYPPNYEAPPPLRTPPGATLVVPVVHGGSVFLTEGNAPVVSRYDVNESDQLVPMAELSFAGVGVAEVPSWYVYIVSDTKGYVYDAAGSRLVAWNPSTMLLTGAEIDLSATEREGFVPNLMLEFFGPRRRGSQLIVPLSWFDQDFNYRHASGFVVIDTETDQLVAVEEDERCGEAYGSVEAPNGDLYFFPSADSSAQHFLAEGFQPTCLLRLPSDGLEFDVGEPFNLSALGSGSAASGVVPDGGTGFFFSSVDDALWQARENDGEAYWRMWHYDFATQASRPLEALPVWAGTTYYVNVGGTPYLPHWTTGDAGDRTTLYQLNGSAEPTPLFSFDASWYGFNRLR